MNLKGVSFAENLSASLSLTAKPRKLSTESCQRIASKAKVLASRSAALISSDITAKGRLIGWQGIVPYLKPYRKYV